MEFLSAAANEIFTVVGQSILHSEVPNEYRGRVMGIWGMTYTLAQPMGSMQVGFLASAITAPLAVAISGGVACAIVLLGVTRDPQVRAIGKESRVVESQL